MNIEYVICFFPPATLTLNGKILNIYLNSLISICMVNKFLFQRIENYAACSIF